MNEQQHKDLWTAIQTLTDINESVLRSLNALSNRVNHLERRVTRLEKGGAGPLRIANYDARGRSERYAPRLLDSDSP